MVSEIDWGCSTSSSSKRPPKQPKMRYSGAGSAKQGVWIWSVARPHYMHPTRFHKRCSINGCND